MQGLICLGHKLGDYASFAMELLWRTVKGCNAITWGDYARVAMAILEETMQGLP